MYTSEVLAVVMQQLMEQSPLPMLLMRTVIQSLTMYPRLGGFVMNILSRLIMKQVTRPGHPGLPGRGLLQDALPTDGRQNPRLFQPVWPLSRGSPRAENKLYYDWQTAGTVQPSRGHCGRQLQGSKVMGVLGGRPD